ncbi:MAG: LamG-like jellyroll fold domain-containing protein [Planctomycetota bacterium]|jgi:hypothetical protein
MSKKLYFLISFVLVLGLSGLAQAGTPIIVDNNSFEYDCNGVQVTCHVGHSGLPGSMCDGSIAGWRYLRYGGAQYAWVGVDVNCGSQDAECDNCHDWIEYPDGTANLYFQGTTSIHQIFDHNLVYGMKYTMAVDLFAWDSIVLQFFSPNDVCYPDANHLVLSNTEVTPDIWYNTDAARDMYERDVKHIYIVTDESLVGRKLGIKIGGDSLVGGTDEGYLWADHVRLEHEWASNAWDPDPSDEAKDVTSQALTLSWLPGLWAVSDTSGHQVYFGTSWAEVNDANTSSDPNIYRGSVGITGPDVNNRYSYVIPAGDLPLGLGQTYYWRIDEVNDSYGGPVPKPWKGNVWSFEVEGRAKNVYPSHGGSGVPALNLVLRWAPGTGAAAHDVYFGSNKTAVEDANTATAGIYRVNQAVDANTYPVEDLDVRRDYFWRIDEVNTNTGTFVKGNVWRFRTGAFLIVDSFEWYPTNEALKAIWKDYWADTASKNGAQIFIETEPNMVHTGAKSMKFTYVNNAAHKVAGSYVGSWAEANASELSGGTNWTLGGVKALVIYFQGDGNNIEDTTWVYGGVCQDHMWVSLEDSTNPEGVVKYDGDMNNIKDEFWHEWNVDLQDFNDAGVVLSDVSKVYLGFGGNDRAGQTKSGAGTTYGYPDTVYFDDIQLWPPRCMPSVTGIDVLHSLGDITGGEEGAPDCNTNYLDFDIMAQGWMMTDGNVIATGQDATLTMAAGEPNWATAHVGTGSLGFDPNIKVDVNNPRLNGSSSLSITAWVYRDGEMDGYEGLVTSREGAVTTEMTNGKGATQVGYCWNNINATWQWNSGVAIPEKTWTFVAMSVDPTGCTLYAQPAGGSQSSNRQTIELGRLGAFANGFWIGRGYAESRYWKGGMDDVRIYNWALDDANMAKLADMTGEPFPCPVYHYKFDDGSGLVAADSGCGTEFYNPVQSAANLTDPEQKYERIVNFRDYRILAEHWLEKHSWP